MDEGQAWLDHQHPGVGRQGVRLPGAYREAVQRCVGISLRIECCGLCDEHAVCRCLSCAQRVRRDKSAVLRRQPTQPVQPAPSLAHRYPMHGVCLRIGQQCADVRPRGSITDTVTHVSYRGSLGTVLNCAYSAGGPGACHIRAGRSANAALALCESRPKPAVPPMRTRRGEVDRAQT